MDIVTVQSRKTCAATKFLRARRPSSDGVQETVDQVEFPTSGLVTFVKRFHFSLSALSTFL